jgi:hypothetical protein
VSRWVRMKGYILIKNGDECFYLTIQTSQLIPTFKPIINPNYAVYNSSNFLIKRITSCNDETITKTELVNVIDYYHHFTLNVKVGEIKLSETVCIYKTLKAIRLSLTNDSIRDGWVYEYDNAGFLYNKYRLRHGKRVIDIEYSSNTIIKRNYFKNETTVTYRDLSKKPSIKYPSSKYPFIAQFNHKDYVGKSYCVKTFFYISETLYNSDGSLYCKHRYDKKTPTDIWCFWRRIIRGKDFSFHGITFNSQNNIRGVFWFGKYVSKNLQKWYHTPWNFTCTNKIKCF